MRLPLNAKMVNSTTGQTRGTGAALAIGASTLSLVQMGEPAALVKDKQSIFSLRGALEGRLALRGEFVRWGRESGELLGPRGRPRSRRRTQSGETSA